MKAPRSHTHQGVHETQPNPTPIQIELMEQKAVLERLMEGVVVKKPRRSKWAAPNKAKSSSQASRPKSRKQKSRNRKAVLAAYKAERGID